MKLYMYYLNNNNEVGKEVETGVRENKTQYVIPVGGKSRLSKFHEWKLPKNCCDKVQVDNSLCHWSPCIISAHADLDNIPQLAEMLLNISKSCESVNNKIKELSQNQMENLQVH